MAPYLDIYVLTPRRDRETIERFLDRYVDRAKSADRTDEDLMIRTLAGGPDAYAPERISTLEQALTRGLDRPRVCFPLYLTSKPGHDQALLGFTADDKLVLGLSLDDFEEKDETLERAKAVMDELAREFGGTLGFIREEEPPPFDEAAFRAQKEHALHFREY